VDPLAKHFEKKTRDSGESFFTLADDAPEWLCDAVRDAHQGTLPNDWIYSECRAAVEAFDEGTLDDEDAIHEHADNQVDVYTRELYRWAADMCLTDTWAEAEEEAKDLGDRLEDTEKRLAVIQYCAIARIAGTMLNACKEHAAEEDAAE
jgi:hypothetical protein